MQLGLTSDDKQRVSPLSLIQEEIDAQANNLLARFSKPAVVSMQADRSAGVLPHMWPFDGLLVGALFEVPPKLLKLSFAVVAAIVLRPMSVQVQAKLMRKDHRHFPVWLCKMH